MFMYQTLPPLPSVSCESDNSILSRSGELEHVRKGALIETEDLTDRIRWTGADAGCGGLEKLARAKG